MAFPSLLPFVLAGIAVGLLPLLLERGGRRESSPGGARSRAQARRRWSAVLSAIGGVVGVLGLGAAVLSLLPHSGAPSPEPRTTIAIPVTYLGQGTYERDPERLALLDRVVISLDDLRGAAEDYRLLRKTEAVEKARTDLAGDPLPSLGAGKLERLLVTHLSRHGWELVQRSTEGDTFAKRREVSLRSRVLPTETGNEVPLPRLPADSAAAAVLFDFRFVEGSQLLLVAPTRTFDSTRPASEREERLAANLEERRVPVAAGEVVEVDVRSPWFRSGALSALAGWIVSGGKYLLGILLGLVIAVLSEPVKAWLRRRLKIGKSAEESA
ncbi:MAG TPA: hypothetical protein VGV69_09530 [Solirubrobacterales bacterium]|nr:hypothetical protein [Solirubrobacterales bacterium]